MHDRTLLVATDFSTRSDRALRRAVLLAKDIDARMRLVHVVDNDQPLRIVKAERLAASEILDEQARSIVSRDGLDCEALIVEGDPFEGITSAADDFRADLVIIGPHRRQALKDVFVGTTAERVVRSSRCPVLMANGVPAGAYRHALVAVDFSPCAADALRAVTDLGIGRSVAVSVVHVFEAPGTSAMMRGSVDADRVADYLEGEQDSASRKLDAFLSSTGMDPIGRFVRQVDTSVATSVTDAALEASADLIVVGTSGRSGIANLLLGSVAQQVLRSATVDVLAVPPTRA